MTFSLLSVSKNFWLTVLSALLIVFGGLFIIHHVSPVKKDVAATGFLLDLVITFPLIYYYFIIYKLKQSKWSIMLVITCCCAVAYFILPAHQRQYVIQLRKLTVLIELGGLIYIASKIREIISIYKQLQADFPDVAYNLYQSMTTVLGNGIGVKFFASELTVLRFGLLCWKKPMQSSKIINSFSVYKDAGYPALIGVMLFVCLIEIVAVHLLLLQHSKTAAVVLTIVSVYGMLFVVGDLSAIVKSPILIMEKLLLLRVGFRWRALVEIDNIASVKKINENFQPETNCFKGSILKSSGNVLITFKNPVLIERLYKIPITVNSIITSIDREADFLIQLTNNS